MRLWLITPMCDPMQMRFSFEYSDRSGSPVLPRFFFSIFDVGNTEYFAAEETYTTAACGGGDVRAAAHAHATLRDRPVADSIPPVLLARSIPMPAHNG